MLRRHPKADLLAYAEGELSGAAAQSVAEHLVRCPRCRRRLDALRLGVALARRLEPVALPAEQAAAIRSRLVRFASPPRTASVGPRRRISALAGAAAVLVVLLGAAVLVQKLRTSTVDLRRESGPPSALEQRAIAFHLQRLGGTARLDFESGSATELRQWIAAQAGLDAALARGRPAEDAGRYQPVGAKLLEVSGARCVAVAYRIDSQPVTLLTAHAADLTATPARGLLGKRIHYRFDRGRRLKLLTWTSSGQTYSLVSDLPQLGEQSCVICHTDPERRRLIQRLGAAL